MKIRHWLFIITFMLNQIYSSQESDKKHIHLHNYLISVVKPIDDIKKNNSCPICTHCLVDHYEFVSKTLQTACCSSVLHLSCIKKNINQSMEDAFGCSICGQSIITNKYSFFKAILDNEVEKIGYYIKHKFDVNIQDKYGNTALMYSAAIGNYIILKILINSGAKIDIKNNEGFTALVFALTNRHLDQELIQSNISTDLNFNLFKYLIHIGSNIDLIFSKNKSTLLILASHYGYIDFVQILIENRADINLKNSKGESALMIAISSGHKEIVEMLISAGADIDVVSHDNTTPIGLALSLNRLDIVKLIFNAKIENVCSIL